jgi:hypothetical protein
LGQQTDEILSRFGRQSAIFGISMGISQARFLDHVWRKRGFQPYDTSCSRPLWSKGNPIFDVMGDDSLEIWFTRFSEPLVNMVRLRGKFDKKNMEATQISLFFPEAVVSSMLYQFTKGLPLPNEVQM